MCNVRLESNYTRLTFICRIINLVLSVFVVLSSMDGDSVVVKLNPD